MKLSKQYITDRLQNTSVQNLAIEIADDMAEQYKGRGVIDHAATVAKFEKMMQPMAPKTTTAADLMRAHGVTVTAVQ